MKEPELRVLMLEDEPTDAEVMENALREAGLAISVQRVEAREEFERALEEFSPDVILADCKLPHYDGLSAVKLARERMPSTPVIIVTGTLPDERAVELLREGAVDYVLKDRLARLAPSVRRALDEARNEGERRKAEQDLRRQLDELRRFQNATVERELRIKELKEENQHLKDRLAVLAKERA